MVQEKKTRQTWSTLGLFSVYFGPIYYLWPKLHLLARRMEIFFLTGKKKKHHGFFESGNKIWHSSSCEKNAALACSFYYSCVSQGQMCWKIPKKCWNDALRTKQIKKKRPTQDFFFSHRHEEQPREIFVSYPSQKKNIVQKFRSRKVSRLSLEPARRCLFLRYFLFLFRHSCLDVF